MNTGTEFNLAQIIESLSANAAVSRVIPEISADARQFSRILDAAMDNAARAESGMPSSAISESGSIMPLSVDAAAPAEPAPADLAAVASAEQPLQLATINFLSGRTILITPVEVAEPLAPRAIAGPELRGLPQWWQDERAPHPAQSLSGVMALVHGSTASNQSERASGQPEPVAEGADGDLDDAITSLMAWQELKQLTPALPREPAPVALAPRAAAPSTASPISYLDARRNTQTTRSAEPAAAGLVSAVQPPLQPLAPERMAEAPTQAPARAPVVAVAAERPVAQALPLDMPALAAAQPEVPTPVPTQVKPQVQTPVGAQVQTQVPTSIPTAVPTPVQTSVRTPIETPVETQVQTQVQTSVPTQVQTSIPTAVPTPVETLVEIPVETQVQTSVQPPVQTAVQPQPLPQQVARAAEPADLAPLAAAIDTPAPIKAALPRDVPLTDAKDAVQQRSSQPLPVSAAESSPSQDHRAGTGDPRGHNEAPGNSSSDAQTVAETPALQVKTQVSFDSGATSDAGVAAPIRDTSQTLQTLLEPVVTGRPQPARTELRQEFADTLLSFATEQLEIPEQGAVTRLRLEVSPPELGNLEIEVTQGPDALDVRIIASDEAAAATLRESEHVMRDLLSRNESGRISIDVSTRDSGQQGRRREPGSEPDTAPGKSRSRVVKIRLNNDNNFDIYV